MKKELSDLLRTPIDRLNRGQRRNLDRLIREDRLVLENTLAALQTNGAGFHIDRELRTLIKEVNDQSVEGHQPPMRRLWDTLSGFLTSDQFSIGTYYRPLEERDHAYRPDDYYASRDIAEIKAATFARLSQIREGVIHHFTPLGDVHQLPFEDDSGAQIVIAGASFVRHGSHLHWMTVGGPIVDLQEITRQRRALLLDQADTIKSNNPGIEPAMLKDILNPSAVPLPDTTDIWTTHTLGLFNLDTLSHEIRLFTRGWSSSLAIFSDQFEQMYAYDTDPAVRRMVDKTMKEIEVNTFLFEVAETCFDLPAYFAAKVAFTKPVQRETDLALTKDANLRRKALHAPGPLRIPIRSISTLDMSSGHDQSRQGDRPFAPPRFRVEVDGFWRRLAPGSIGRDISGKAVEGRTWVSGHQRWKDRPHRSSFIRLKTPIQDTIERAQTLAGSSESITIKV